MYALSSLAVETEEGKVKISGCNGHKLTVSDLDLTEGNLNLSAQRALVPREGAILISKLVKSQSKIKWGFGEKQLLVTTPSAQLVVFLTSGEYPNTKALIGAISSPDTLHVSQEELASALRRAMIFTDEYCSILFSIENNRVAMVSNEDSVGSATESVNAVYSGVGKVEIPLNPRYVMDTLSLMKPTDTVEIQLTNETSPVIIRSQESNSLFSLIMPVQR
jgi:DNA polymerase III sliding clamp (beta) subunit (PCNA family)